jgi:hypothetical protein
MTYLAAMVRRLPPTGAGVVPGSTPVVVFGDPARARIATLGINPSRREFTDEQGRMLTGAQRRLATLASLGASRLDRLDDDQVESVAAECGAYFRRQPYRRWFDPLDALIRAGAGASYYDWTTCHLDLVQWATDPVWGQMTEDRVRRVLMEDGVPHLRAQLAANQQIRLVLCNGRQVIDQVRAAGLASLAETGVIRSGTVTCYLYEAEHGDRRWLGWSANLQSGRGISTALKEELSAWLARASEMPGARPRPARAGSEAGTVGPAAYAASGPGPHARPVAAVPGDGYLPRGLRTTGKRELVSVLGTWLEQSAAPTIGDIGTFGRTAWLRIDVNGIEVVLNADTKRTAVQAFIRAAAADPARPWLVTTTRTGRAVKVLPGPRDEPAPGWYAYLTRPGTAGQLI